MKWFWKYIDFVLKVYLRLGVVVIVYLLYLIIKNTF